MNEYVNDDARHATTAGRAGVVVLAASLVILVLSVPGLAGATRERPDAPAGEGPRFPPNARELAKPLPEPSSEAEREASQDAYADLGGEESGELAEDSFPKAFEAVRASLPEPAGVLDYRGKHSALVETGPNDRTALLDSSVPLRIREDGGPRRVDLALEETPDGYEPGRAAVPVSVPDQLEEGIEVGEEGLSITVDHALPAGEARPIADGAAVLYREAAKDTDLIVAPSPAGVELFTQIRSAESPEEFELPLELPAGARLEPTDKGGAKIVRGEQRADILAPLAFDADGVSVRARMRIEGNALVLSVSHREADPRYPILVDPPVEYFPWYQAGDPFGLNDGIWRSFQTPGVNHYVAANTTRQDMGLWVQSYPGTYPYNSHGGWAYAVPHSSITSDGSSPNPSKTSAYVTQAGFSPIWHWVYWQQGHWNPFVQLCIVDATNNACLYDYNNPPRSYFSYWGGYPWGPSTVVLDNIQGNQQAEQVAFDHPSDANAYNPSQLWTRVGGVNITMADGEVPTVTPSHSMVGGGSFPSGWTNSTATARVAVAAQDGGLGLKSVRVKLGCNANGQGCSSSPAAKGMPPVGSSSGQCVGTKREGICPQTTPSPVPSWDYSLASIPEGLSYGLPSATDALDKVSPTGQGRWELRVDRSPPTATVDGSLFANKDNVRADRGYELNLAAVDGSLASPGQMRSGVKTLEVFVDDEEAPRFTQTQSCPSQNGSCPMNATWRVPPGEFIGGLHTIRVVSKDMVDNVNNSVQQFTISAIGDEDEPQVALVTSLPGLDGTTPLQVTATDLGPVPSGVTHLEVYAGEELIGTFDQECPNGGCSMQKTLTLAPDQSPALVDIVAMADDQA